MVGNAHWHCENSLELDARDAHCALHKVEHKVDHKEEHKVEQEVEHKVKQHQQF